MAGHDRARSVSGTRVAFAGANAELAEVPCAAGQRRDRRLPRDSADSGGSGGASEALPGVNLRLSSTATALVPVSTERLVFSLWRADDWPFALALWGDPRVTALVGGPLSEAKVRERFEMELAQQRLHGVQYWPMFLKSAGEHVGCCGLRPYELSRGLYELGF